MWIQTFSNKAFHYDNPQPEMICLEDVAHALSMLCRFGGHSKYFYSVAQHSIHVCSILQKEQKSHPEAKRLALLGLMHDAAEAYIVDIPRPLKEGMEGVEDLEDKIRQVIFQALCPSLTPEFVSEHYHIIKDVDNRVLAAEGRDLFDVSLENWIDDFGGGDGITHVFPMDSRTSEDIFLQSFKHIMGLLNGAI